MSIFPRISHDTCYFITAVRNTAPAYYKLENDRLYYWYYSNYADNTSCWTLIAKDVITTHNTSTSRFIENNLEPIDAQLYSCPLCQNTGATNVTPSKRMSCKCVQNPFSITNKLS